MYKLEKNFERCLHILFPRLLDDNYARKMYGALCSMRWRNLETREVYSCSWRYAGGLVAGARYKKEHYLDFYCGGNEGVIDTEIEKDLGELGWVPLPWSKVSFDEDDDGYSE